MDRYITKSKYFTPKFNTAIFSDPIRIYFSNKHESQALELYFHLQQRKNQWEKFLNKRGEGNNYCYIMLYPESEQYTECFAEKGEEFSPADMGSDYVIGINGPLDEQGVDQLLNSLDDQIGFKVPS
ncbi:MAG: hypothetical protein MJK18_10910 [Bdellovibrionales bacterium]|nr:hypothetical protein [Bdellovibrionales bacterium]